MAVGLDYEQMLASINALQSPQTNVRLSQPDFIKSQFAVKKEKQSQQKEFQALMEQELAKASDSGGWGFLGDLGSLVSFFNPVIGAALTTAGATGTAARQKSKLGDTLQSSRALSKYANTWLGDEALAYKKNIKDLAGDIDPLMTGLTTAATSYGTGKVSGKIGEQFGDLFKGDTVLPDVITDTGSSMEITPGETIRGFTEGAGGPLKNLRANIKEGGGGLKGVKELFSDWDMESLLDDIDDTTFDKLLQVPAFFQMLKR